MAEPSVNAAQRSNVLFIVSDELIDWFGFLDTYPGTVHTPNIDRLAKQSVTFTRAYCNAPMCSPSRASFLSGLRPSTSGAYYGEKFRRIMPDVVSLPQYFRQHGYHTVGGGKIYHSSRGEDDRAWDDYLDYRLAPLPKKYPLPIVSDYKYHRWAPSHLPEQQMAGDVRTAQWAAKFLGRQHRKPFFLGVGFYKPHHPWVVPRKYFDLYPLDEIRRPKVKEDDLADIPPYGQYYATKRKQLSHERIVAAGQWEHAIRGYLASVSYMDAQLGRVLEALRRSPHGDNTIVVLIGDNGMHFGQKRHWTKWALWEEATRVAMLIKAPGVGIAGARCDQPVSLLDIYPTLVALCGLPANSANEGVSLVPQLRDPKAKKQTPAITTMGHQNHAVRTHRWRYIRYRTGSEELYDHRSDPHEWKNLARDPAYREVIEQLRNWLPKRNAPEDDFASRIYWPGDPTLRNQ